MNGIGDFLKKYLHLEPEGAVSSRAVVKALSERFGIQLEERSIRVSGREAYVSAPGALKSEIVLHKQQLLARVAELSGEKGVTDIR